jgi:hypothetical protein
VFRVEIEDNLVSEDDEDEEVVGDVDEIEEIRVSV